MDNNQKKPQFPFDPHNYPVDNRTVKEDPYALYLNNNNNNKKKKKKPILLWFGIILLSVASIGSIGFLIYTIVKKNSENEPTLGGNVQNSIPSDVALESIDKKTKIKLLNSTYSVRIGYGSSVSFGTAWSFALNNNDWYLLTNYHVVQSFLYYYQSTKLIQNINDFKIAYQDESGSKKTIPLSRLGNDVSIDIISDNSVDNNIALFSDRTSNNWYSLDMALIRIRSSVLASKIRSSTNINLPYNLYLKQNKTITSIKSIGQAIIGGFPKINSSYNPDSTLNWPYYHLQIIESVKNMFHDDSWWNSRQYDYIQPTTPKHEPGKDEKPYSIKQRGLISVSSVSYKEAGNGNPNEWTLVAGASGSPVYSVNNYETDEPNWIPYGIFWGGLKSSMQKDRLFPGITFLVSNLSNSKYNVYDNFTEFLKTFG